MTVPVLLLNDTDEGQTHFGCMRVMRTIRHDLAQRGLVDLPSIKVGTDWRRDPALTALIDNTRLLVINGEGTLHHGKRRGKWLLEAGARVKANGGKVALINALWQQNPVDWGDLARGFDVLSCRDSRSADGLARQTGRQLGWMGDLSMRMDWTQHDGGREGITVGCSVHSKVTEALARHAAKIGAEFMPMTTTIKAVPARLTGWRRRLRAVEYRWRDRRFTARYPGARFVRDDSEYIAAISQRSLLITGRFHAVCLAVLSRTPFVAVSSNSWKIEALIADIGLDPARSITLDRVDALTTEGRDWAYSAQELAAIDARLAQWRAEGDRLFDQIAGLVMPDPPISAARSF
jgi:hypothetical protein